MDKRVLIFLGLALFVIGLVFSMNALSNMTGLVISEEVSQRGSSFFGFSFLLIGLFLLVISRHNDK